MLLYMHQRGDVIGLVKNIEVSEKEVTGELAFDEATELSRQAKAQFEFGSLRMVSVGIDIVELSAEKELLVPGQTVPTVTKSRLWEVSLVDIGANDDALVLRYKGAAVTLAEGGVNPLPCIIENPNCDDMEEMIKRLALLLGLPETATAGEVEAKIEELAALPGQLEAAQKEVESLRKTEIESAVDAAIAGRRLPAARREDYISLGLKAGKPMLDIALSGLSPAVKPTDFIDTAAAGGYKKLSDVPAGQLEALRENDPATYKRLYSAEYGIECDI